MFVVKMFVDEEHVATFSVREFEMDYRTMTFHCLRENSEESYQCSYMSCRGNEISIRIRGVNDENNR